MTLANASRSVAEIVTSGSAMPCGWYRLAPDRAGCVQRWCDEGAQHGGVRRVGARAEPGHEHAALGAGAADAQHDRLVARIGVALEAELVVDDGLFQRMQLLFTGAAEPLGAEREAVHVAALGEVLHGLGHRLRTGRGLSAPWRRG